MADEQPGGGAAAAVPDPARVEGTPDEPSTVDVPARWSGAAAVPATGPARSRWSRRRPSLASDEPDDPAMMPPVDPWEGQDTPWDPLPLPPEVLPPTRVDPAVAPPPTQVEPPPAAGPAPPPTPAEQMPPTPAEQKPPTPAGQMPPTPAKQKRGWGRKPKPAPRQSVNRIPVAARPPVQHPPPPPRYQRRLLQGRPAPPPPGWRPPNQRPLPPPRRRRRWPRNLAVFTILSTLCCCGVPALFAFPAAGQHPVTAVLPDSVSDLDLRDDAASRRAAQRLSQELKSANAFAGIYSDGNGKRVTIFGITGLRLTPRQDVEAQIDRLSAEYDIRDVRPYDLGVPGAHERCGVGRAAGTSIVVCAWADHGSLATVLLTRRSVPDSAELTGVLRSAVLVRE
ncbi:MAG TPA: hypothetical protein VFR35_17600 [Actinoplanes sp.]|nr:hypothetical protein [Actinoplanes sp.]